MSVGDQICEVCGNWIANHKDQKPCNMIINCSMCNQQFMLNWKPDKCPHCGCNWTYRWTETKFEYKNPASTVDIIVSTEDGLILLIKRKNDPFKDTWALPGGYINYGQETLPQAASRELKEETGIDEQITFYDLFGVFSDPKRDPRGHTISHVYYRVFEDTFEIKAGDDAKEAKWFNMDALPEMAFDHAEIINLFRLRK